jgi:hypothetical protein
MVVLLIGPAYLTATVPSSLVTPPVPVPVHEVALLPTPATLLPLLVVVNPLVNQTLSLKPSPFTAWRSMSMTLKARL